MGVFSIVVERHEKVIAVCDGRVVGVLGPGRHRRQRRTAYERVDVRSRVTTVSPQEILTADGSTVEVSASVRWEVGDPALYTSVRDAEAVVYLAVQIALRDALAVREVAELVRDGRRSAGPAALEAAHLAGVGVGIVVDDVVVKDIVLP